MSNMRVDVVTGPVRYRWTPLLGLIALAMIPVVALSALVVWSDGQADEHEAAVDGNAAGPVPAAPSVSAVTPALTTSVLSYRRAPESMADVGNDNRLSESMDQLAAFIDERSCLAVSVDGRPVTAHNVDAAVIPASTQKLFVAAVALDVLGADHRFTTTVQAAPAVDGVIEGDLFLVGGGDPLLVSTDFPTDGDRFAEFNTTPLDDLADAVVAAGVTAIRGSVVGDGSRYDDEFVNPAWGADVAFVEAGPYDALVVNDSRVRGRSGRERDPNVAAAREFARLLTERGVRISNGWESGLTDPALPVVATVESQTLDAVIAEMLTTSDNDTAEMLVKELGVADGGVGTVNAGLDVVTRTLGSWGVPMEGVKLVDGSGLSSENRATCGAVLAVLQRSEGTAVANGLPVAGRSGTLEDAFVGTTMEGRLRAKTGTLGNPPVDLDPPAAKGLAGYLGATSGDTIEFVMILNSPDIDEPENYAAFWLALGERLDSYPDGPALSTVGPR